MSTTEQIEKLKSEILKYIPEDLLNHYLETIKIEEEKYSGAVEKCSEDMVRTAISLITDIGKLTDTTYSRCLDIQLRREKPLKECRSILDKLLDIKWEKMEKLIEDLKKCGCQLT